MILLLLLLARAADLTLAAMGCQFKDQRVALITEQQFRNSSEQFTIAFSAVEILVMCLIWFWGRWKLRSQVWKRFGDGHTLHFLLTSEAWVQDLVRGILSIVLVLAAIKIEWMILQFLPLASCLNSR